MACAAISLLAACQSPSKKAETEKNKNGQKRVYREGDSVEGGLVVQTIHADHVVLIRGSEKQILQLHKKQEKKP